MQAVTACSFNSRVVDARSGRSGSLRIVYFFAAIPDAGSASGVAELRQELRAKHRLRGKPIATERLHVTLHRVGDFATLPEGIAARAGAVASSISMRPFKVEFNGALSFRGRPGNSPFVLQGDEGVIGLLVLQHRLGRLMENAGLGRADPHYTRT